MMPTTWTIAVDWERDGDYSGQYDNITGRVISANWFLGMRTPYQDVADDSMLTLVLDNSDRRYSPEFAGSPLAGEVQPFRPVRVQSNDGVTTRTHWVGWIERIQPDVNIYGARRVTITAAGPMQFLKAAETHIGLQENQRTSDVIDELIKEVVIPPALSTAWVLGIDPYSLLGQTTKLTDSSLFSDLDAGQIFLTLAADNWITPGDESPFNVYRALADVVAAERGRFFFSREGKALFWNRARLQDEIPSALTLNNEMEDMDYVYAGADIDFKNEIVVTCHPRELGEAADQLLWKLDAPVKIPPKNASNPKKSERTIGVRYRDTSNGSVRVGAKDIYLDNVVFSNGSATITLEQRANSAVITLQSDSTTQGATLKTAQVRGRKILDFGQMDATSRDDDSIALYGRRALAMNLLSVDDYEDAEEIAGYELRRRSKPRGVVRSLTLRSHGTQGGGQHAAQLALTVGQVITVTESQSAQSSRRYVIIGEAHRLTTSATLLETTWYVEPAAEAPFPWKLGVVGRGELGTKTLLGF